MPRKALHGLHGSDGQARLPHVTVAVIDSGVEALHDDLRSSQVRAGVDLLNPCGDGRTDSSGHGTAVAGVIASVDDRDRLSRFGSRGEGIDVAAPGSRVQTLAVNDGYRIGSGTSVAAPLVAATVARMKALNPKLSRGRRLGWPGHRGRRVTPCQLPGLRDAGWLRSSA